MPRTDDRRDPPIHVPLKSSVHEDSDKGSPWWIVGAVGVLLITVILLGGLFTYFYLRSEPPQIAVAEEPTPLKPPAPSPIVKYVYVPREQPQPALPQPTREPTREPVPEPTTALTPRRSRLIQPQIHISSGSYSSVQFEVTRFDTRVVGAFTSSSPVEMFIANARFTGDLASNARFPTVWFSGRVTGVRQINVPLAPGSYILGYNNRFSVFTSKDIRAEVFLEEP
ncbi:MAG: hypothetical protein ND895_22165 [Pyrinomonadaceae bacterium]|nr:hypothetical protein [Pyrinomonadaceae bacterium]